MKLKRLVTAFLLCCILAVYIPGTLVTVEAKQVASLDISNSEGWYSEFDYSDPMWITDEDFFGKYDAINGEWIKTPYFLYDDYEGLSQVKECVMQGNYEDAKYLITEYYKIKFQNQPRAIKSTTDPRDVLKAQVMAHNSFLLSGTVLDIMEFSPVENDVVGDITSIITSMTTSTATDTVRTFELMAIERDGVEVTAYSCESGYAPYVTIQVNGAVRTYEATYDTYLRGGSYATENFGGEETLKIGEDYDLSNTTRTRITFDFNDIEKGDIVTTAELHLIGKSSAQDNSIKKYTPYL